MPVTRRQLIVLPAAAAALVYASGPALAAARAAQDTAPPSEPAAESVPYTSGTEGYDTFRIPAVLRTAHGTLIAFAEARASSSDSAPTVVTAKRSADGGRSWGPLTVVTGDGSDTRGNPTPVLDPRTGRVVLLTCSNAADATEQEIMSGTVSAESSRRVWAQHSDDDGRSFSAPVEITAGTKRSDWRWYATGPGHAVALSAGPHRGRLVVAANHSSAPPAGSADTGTEAKYYGGHSLYSDDGGHTWRIGFSDDTPDGVVNANESSVAQLPDGRLYFNARNQNGTAPGVRVDAWSEDGGRTLTRPYQPQTGLVGPVVEGSVLRPAGGPLLFSGPADPAARKTTTLRASQDGGRHWTAVRTLSDLPAGYSDLVQCEPGVIGVLYETGTTTSYDRIAFARIPLAELIP